MTDISTNNWDVVSITDLDTLNSIISTGGLTPADFSVDDAEDAVSVSGTWGAWTVTSNASGAKVNIRCDITGGTVEFAGVSYPLSADGDSAYVEIELALKGISADPAVWAGSEGIVADGTRCFTLMADPDSNVVVVGSAFPGVSLHLVTLILPELIAEWFSDHIADFKQVFSVLLVGLQAKNSDFQWLMPSAYSYAASSSLDDTTAGFGALTLTDGRTGTGALSQNIDIAALELVKPYGANLALVISKALFVKHILMPAAVSIVKGSTEADFTLSDTGLSLSNNKALVWQDFDDGKGGTISPVLPASGFILDLQADYIHLSITGAHYRPNGMCTVTMGVEQNFRYKVENNASGEPVFVPDETGLGDATVSCVVTPDKWVGVMDIVLGVVSGVATLLTLGLGGAAWLGARAAGTVALDAAEGAGGFVMSDFDQIVDGGETSVDIIATEAAGIAAGRVSSPILMNSVKVFGAVAAITGATAAATAAMKGVYEGKYDDMPSFHDFARHVTSATVWPGMTNAELKSASLADSFVIGLELK